MICKSDCKIGYPIAILEDFDVKFGLITYYIDINDIIKAAYLNGEDLVERCFNLSNNDILSLNSYKGCKITDSCLFEGCLVYKLSDRKCYEIHSVSKNSVTISEYNKLTHKSSLAYKQVYKKDIYSKFIRRNIEMDAVMSILDNVAKLCNEKNKKRIVESRTKKGLSQDLSLQLSYCDKIVKLTDNKIITENNHDWVKNLIKNSYIYLTATGDWFYEDHKKRIKLEENDYILCINDNQYIILTSTEMNKLFTKEELV